MQQSKSEHILALATELLDDIELSQLSGEALLLKASRLARLTHSDVIKQWISFELKGYSLTDPLELHYMDIVGRWADKEKGIGYNTPLSQIESLIISKNTKLQAMSTPDTSGEWAFRVMQMYEENLEKASTRISQAKGIKSKVLAHLHSFVSDIYYEKELDNLSESIFEKYKSDVDNLIIANCGNVLEQIPSVMSRLSEDNKESISQALTTVRRIIDSFADSIFPPSADTIEMNGNQVTLGANKHQNRINAFVYQRINSKSRKTKIRQNLSNLYDRVSTGVHNDVTAEEARSLFLTTYLLLGEVLHIQHIEI